MTTNGRSQVRDDEQNGRRLRKDSGIRRCLVPRPALSLQLRFLCETSRVRNAVKLCIDKVVYIDAFLNPDSVADVVCYDAKEEGEWIIYVRFQI